MTTQMIPRTDQHLTTVLTDDLINDWLEYEAKANDASPNTIATYRRSMTTFTAWLSDQGLNLTIVRPGDVIDYKTHLAARFSAQTVNLRLTAVRSFYRYCVGQNLTSFNPASEIKGAKRSKSKQHKRDALTNGEVVGVLRQPDTRTREGLRDKAILVLLSYCALRGVEIHRADIGDLRTRGDRLTLDIQGKGRTEKDEYVIIPIGQEPLIREYLKYRTMLAHSRPDDALFISFSHRSKYGRLSLRAIRGIVKHYYRSAGVVGDKKSTHSLRHSAITNAIRSGKVQPMEVQRWARHQSFDTTLNYYHEVGRLDNPVEDIIRYE